VVYRSEAEGVVVDEVVARFLVDFEGNWRITDGCEPVVRIVGYFDGPRLAGSLPYKASDFNGRLGKSVNEVRVRELFAMAGKCDIDSPVSSASA